VCSCREDGRWSRTSLELRLRVGELRHQQRVRRRPVDRFDPAGQRGFFGRTAGPQLLPRLLLDGKVRKKVRISLDECRRLPPRDGDGALRPSRGVSTSGGSTRDRSRHQSHQDEYADNNPQASPRQARRLRAPHQRQCEGLASPRGALRKTQLTSVLSTTPRLRLDRWQEDLLRLGRGRRHTELAASISRPGRSSSTPTSSGTMAPPPSRRAGDRLASSPTTRASTSSTPRTRPNR